MREQGSTGWFSSGGWAIGLAVGAALAGPPGLEAQETGPGGTEGGSSRPVRPGHYLLVIDHSGSMNARIREGPAQGRTRWDLMTERAADFVQRLPGGSNLWGIIFRSVDSQMPGQAWSESFEQTVGGNPLFPFPDQLSSVSSALGEKANS